MNKICRKCGLEKPLTEYYKTTPEKGGYHTMCKDCTYEYKKSKGYTSGKNHLANVLRWKKKNRDKVWAWQILTDWLRDGRIIKSPYCYGCGIKTEELEAHHDNYKNPLRVHWLCTKCHGREGRNEEAT